MLWKRILEQIQDALPNLPPSPWIVTVNPLGFRQILDANRNVVLTLKERNAHDHRQDPPPSDLRTPEEIEQQEWQVLGLLCMMRNNCETWFEAMRLANIKDIKTPNRKK